MIHKSKMLALALALLGASRVARADAPSAPAPSEKATELYQQANKLYDEGKLASAEALYREAWQLQKTYGIASNLGALELDLGKPVEAVAMLTFALLAFPAHGKPSTRAALEARLERARSLLGPETVASAAPAAAPAAAAAAAAAPAPLPPPVLAPPPLLPPAEPPPPPAPRSLLPGVVLGASGLLALGVGGALIGLAETNRAEAKTLSAQLAATSVSCATPSASCADLHARTSRADSLGNAGIGALAAGGALAAAGLAAFLWPGSGPGSKPKDTALRAAIGASPSGGGVVVIGSF